MASKVNEETVEAKTMRKHYADLTKAIQQDPLRLAVKLYSEDVISRGVLDSTRESNDKFEKSMYLLQVVSDKITADPKVFHDFIAILRNLDSSLQTVAELVITTYYGKVTLSTIISDYYGSDRRPARLVAGSGIVYTFYTFMVTYHDSKFLDCKYAVLVGGCMMHVCDKVCMSSLIGHLKRNQGCFTGDQGEENEEGIQLPKRLKLSCGVEGGQHTFVKKKCQDIRLSWKLCCALPATVSSGAAVASGNTVYYVEDRYSSCKIYEYEISENIWCNEIQCPRTCVSLTVLSGLLTLVGGGSTLLSLVENPKDGTKHWSESFKPMQVNRSSPATASNGKHLIVAGGDVLTNSTVEVMTIDTQEWHDTITLPNNDGYIGSATIIGDNLYITFVRQSITSCCSTVTCSITKLLGKSATQSIVKPLLWQKLPEGPPLYKPRTVQLCGNLLAIGGQVTNRDYHYMELKYAFEFKGSAYIYNEEEGEWSFVCQLPSKIGYPDHNFVVASLSDDRIMVMGGRTYTNEDEIAPSSDIVHMGSIF